MRYLMIICAMGLMLVSYCLGQESNEDVIYLKNGGIMHGTIIEMIPNKSVKLRSKDGNVYVFSMDEIERVAKEPVTKSEVETWYLYFALGYGKPFYASGLQEKVDQLSSDWKRISLSMDLLGVYWPLRNNRTILGGSVSAIADQFGTIMIQQHLYSFSIMHFLKGIIGNGIFIRGDAGIAVLDFDARGRQDLSFRDAGVGCMVGGGYSFPVSNETRITANLHYSMRIIKGDFHGALSINAGILL
jgi:hypothetical protein